MMLFVTLRMEVSLTSTQIPPLTILVVTLLSWYQILIIVSLLNATSSLCHL